MARALSRQLDILGSSLPKTAFISSSSFLHFLSFFSAKLALQISPNQILVHLYAFPPLKLLIVFLFCSTATFNSAPEASFYPFFFQIWSGAIFYLFKLSTTL